MPEFVRADSDELVASVSVHLSLTNWVNSLAVPVSMTWIFGMMCFLSSEGTVDARI